MSLFDITSFPNQASSGGGRADKLDDTCLSERDGAVNARPDLGGLVASRLAASGGRGESRRRLDISDVSSVRFQSRGHAEQIRDLVTPRTDNT